MEKQKKFGAYRDDTGKSVVYRNESGHKCLPREEKVAPYGNGCIVIVTSKTTGHAVSRWCKDEDDAEMFIDYASDVVDKNGQIWWSVHQANMLQAFDKAHYE